MDPIDLFISFAYDFTSNLYDFAIFDIYYGNEFTYTNRDSHASLLRIYESA